MGSFYTNVIAVGVHPDAAVAVCRRPAFVAAGDGFVVVFAEDDDDGADPEKAHLSSKLACTTLTISVHDSDLLVFVAHRSGSLAVEGCVPDPSEYFGGDSDGPGVPTGSALVAALGRGDPHMVDEVLAHHTMDAEERHEHLLDALGLPIWSARFGYRYLSSDSSAYTGPPLMRVD